ncbi:hypothetical protein [uncultured Proteiniphilum sp.]|uniref:hypothetical protein n=1 Tax=uncultured Proteiniphilum sp. TaxID=497637 RepID=UPI00262236DB|nr:hypothetical protein [uncultured Proteiniphilum sp.]
MNGIDNLLEKYFNGVSSTEEEKRLKNYFKGAGVLPEHEVYRPLFAVFNNERQIKAPVMIFPYKKIKRPAFTRRIIIPAAGAAAVVLLAITLSTLNRRCPQPAEYVVIVNGKQVVNPYKARQYAESMFWEAEKIVERSHQPFREAADMKKNLNAEKILRETEQKIEYIKTNHAQ